MRTKKEKPFKVIALHFTNECSLDCPFCYVEKGHEVMNKDLFLGLPKYLSQITEQVAIGGGEPTEHAKLVKEFAKECKKYNLICNMTTNGHIIRTWTGDTAKYFLSDLTMVSVSLDSHKWNLKFSDNARSFPDLRHYLEVLSKLKTTGVKVGVNLLLEPDLLKHFRLFDLTKLLLGNGADRVYVLHPKLVDFGYDIEKYGGQFVLLSAIYPQEFCVDELTKLLLENNGDEWDKPCHFGRKLMSIDHEGRVFGCSFDDEPLMSLTCAKDILKLPKLETKPKFGCPFVVRNFEIHK